MPEHVHVVLLPLEGSKISSILTTIKQSVSKRALLWLQKNRPEFREQLLDIQPNGESHYRFWQRGGGYDRNLRSVQDVYEKLDYIHANPVRRGLVEKPEEWQWSSFIAWQTSRNNLVEIDRESLPPLQR
jgi:putative transposase